ncbi:Lsr2 dimerization domain-containing protein [Glutamicibacter arilaitensis]|uniref:Lsr2 dimerization domain-containing protein n=2 Tax=Glutamicibacter TaxID=1742989 RepID=UPI003FD3709E
MIRVSDLSGKRDAEVLQFSVGDETFEIDVTYEEKSVMEQTLGKFLTVARRKPSSAKNLPTRAMESKAIREWAEANGHDLSPQGRLPKRIIELYRNR